MPRSRPRITGPIVVAGGEIDATSVTLRFFGDELDPDEVTRLLGSEPTVLRRKGQVIPDRDGRVADTGSWLLSSERQSHKALEMQISGLFDRLTGDVAVWRDLASRYRSDLFCGLWSESWNRGLELSPVILEQICARGLRVGFDIYFLENKLAT